MLLMVDEMRTELSNDAYANKPQTSSQYTSYQMPELPTITNLHKHDQWAIKPMLTMTTFDSWMGGVIELLKNGLRISLA